MITSRHDETETTSQPKTSQKDFNSFRFFEDVLSLIKKGEEERKNDDKIINIIIGKSGSGKSVLANLLGGVELQAERDPNTMLDWTFSGQNLKSPIGHHPGSETSFPVRVTNDEHEVYYDCTGFNDTRGTEREIACAFFLESLVNSADQFRLILTIESYVFQTKSELVTIINHLQDLFPNIDQLIAKLFIVITKVPNYLEVKHFQEKIRRIIQSNSDINENTGAILKSLIEDSGKIGLFREPQWDWKEVRKELLIKIRAINYGRKQTIRIIVPDKAKVAIWNIRFILIDKVNLQIAKVIAKIEEICQNKINASDSFDNLKLLIQELSMIIQLSLEGDNDVLSFLTNLSILLSDINLIAQSANIPLLEKETLEETKKSFSILLRVNLEREIDASVWKDELKFLKSWVEDLTKPNLNDSEDGTTIVVYGIILSANQVEDLLKNRSFKRIEIYCLKAFYLDKDIEHEGITLIIVSPVWKVCGTRIINISGKEGPAFQERGANFHGFPGKPGQSGGNLLGIGKTFINPNQLRILSNGGNGGPGEDGLQGKEGEHGEDGCLDLVKARDQDLLQRRVPVLNLKSAIWDFLTFNGKIKEEYLSSGTPGKQGGNGGKSGNGGIGGYAGHVKIIGDTESEEIKKQTEQGEYGSYGNSGRGGKGGKGGKTYHGIYVDEFFLPEYRGKYNHLKGYTPPKVVGTSFLRFGKYIPHVVTGVLHIGAAPLTPAIIGVQTALSMHLALANSGWVKRPENFTREAEGPEGEESLEINAEDIEFPVCYSFDAENEENSARERYKEYYSKELQNRSFTFII